MRNPTPVGGRETDLSDLVARHAGNHRFKVPGSHVVGVKKTPQ